MKLWEPKGCCLCFSLRTGSLILSSLMLAGCILNLYTVLNALLLHSSKLEEQIKDSCSREAPEIEDCETQVKKIMVSVGTVLVVLVIIKMMCSSLMIYGIIKSKVSFMMPMIVLLLIQLMFTLVSGLVLIVTLAIYISGGQTFGVAIILGVLIFFETYFLLVFRAYYLQIKRGLGQMHDELQEETDNADGIPEQKFLLKLK